MGGAGLGRVVDGTRGEQSYYFVYSAGKRSCFCLEGVPRTALGLMQRDTSQLLSLKRALDENITLSRDARSNHWCIFSLLCLQACSCLLPIVFFSRHTTRYRFANPPRNPISPSLTLPSQINVVSFNWGETRPSTAVARLAGQKRSLLLVRQRG